MSTTQEIELILVRHGNTFGPGDPIVWVGKAQDFPLVPSGRAQAEALGAALWEHRWAPTAAVSGGLKRQVEHLDIALAALSDGALGGDTPPTPERVEALDEVDYGDWGGLSTQEITERFGPEAVEAWNERSEWPTNAGWPEAMDEVQARVHAFAACAAAGAYGERVLACSSNGLMRWFLELAPGGLQAAIEAKTFKVRTGHACRLIAQDGVWTVTHWNGAPGEVVGGA